jgi:phage-related protein
MRLLYSPKTKVHIANNGIGCVLFCIVGGEMVLLHGFVKKIQKTPQADLALAVKRMKEIS